MSDWGVPDQDFSNIVISSWGRQAVGLTLRVIQPTGSTSTAWPTANKAVFVPFVVPVPFTAKLMITCNGSTASGAVDIGIYDLEGNRLVSKGSTAQSGTSTVQSYDITDTTLNPGTYYMALNLSTTTGTFLSYAAVNAPGGGATGMLNQASAFPLPDPATFAAFSMTTGYVPAFGITGRTLV